MQRFPRFAATAAVLALCAGEICAQLPTPGSVLVFPNHRTRFSIVSVINTNISPQTPSSLGGSTSVRYDYVTAYPDPSAPFHPICRRQTLYEFLTPADSLSVMTACHTGQRSDTQGYLVVTAVDPLNHHPWSHDHLEGSILILQTDGAMFAQNAIPVSSPVRGHGRTDLDLDGELDFDGREYRRLQDKLHLDNFIAALDPRLTLLNLTGGEDAINTVYFAVWNDMEIPTSATRQFRCWFDQPLSTIAPTFSPIFLMSRPNDPFDLDTDCDGDDDTETGWAIIDSIDVATPGGFPIAEDGALLGSFMASGGFGLAGRGLWGSTTTQANGSF